jgi:hypothetical protein
MLTPTMALLAELPHDPLIEPRAWKLTCGAPCGCREPLGHVLVRDAAAHLWDLMLDDHYQPRVLGDRRRWGWVKRMRRPRLQPFGAASGVRPAPEVLDGTRQAPPRVQDMRQWEHGRPLPAGQLVGPLGVGRTPADVLIVCRWGHENHVTVEWIEQEVHRLGDAVVALTD